MDGRQAGQGREQLGADLRRKRSGGTAAPVIPFASIGSREREWNGRLRAHFNFWTARPESVRGMGILPGILPMLAAPERRPQPGRPCLVARCPEIEMRPSTTSSADRA
jgi:hypothetical protein